MRYQGHPETTRAWLPTEHFDGRSNLYLFFIEKCLRHLEPGGELIFITPRDFLKATSAANLNRLLYEAGTITDFIELGDARIFEGATPNCAIWRFERGNFSRRTRYDAGGGIGGPPFPLCRRPPRLHACRLHCRWPTCSRSRSARCRADAIFASDKHGTMDFVCSHVPAKTGETKRMIFQTPHPALKRHKSWLLARRIRRFDEQTWWQWGRLHPISERPRIYVNCKTRSPDPFFLHPCRNYDGRSSPSSPHDPAADLEKLRAMLNLVDWANSASSATVGISLPSAACNSRCCPKASAVSRRVTQRCKIPLIKQAIPANRMENVRSWFRT